MGSTAETSSRRRRILTGAQPALEDVVAEFSDSVKNLAAAPTLDSAIEAALCSRVAWGVFYADWGMLGGCRHEVTERIVEAFEQCVKAMRVIGDRMQSAEDVELFEHYMEGTAFRAYLLGLLVTEGSRAVMRANDGRRVMAGQFG